MAFRLAPPLQRRWAGKEGVAALTDALRSTFDGAQVMTSSAALAAHGKDESFHLPAEPDVVFAARSTEEVSQVMRLTKEFGCPVIPFGAGSSLEGHVAALRGGLCLDLTAMNKLLRVDEVSMDCTVQAGMTRMALNNALKATGLFFPVDPGADATLGGMAATGASGTSTVRYGGMRSNVLGLTAVLQDGTVIKTGSRARKCSSGYDLTSLFLGSEGTLGCITDLTLSLHGQPEQVAAAVCAFDSTKGCVDTVVQCLQYGIPVARAEFLDAHTMRAVQTRFPELKGFFPQGKPCLFLEFHGTEAGVQEQIERAKGLSEENGLSGDFRFATSEEDRNLLWKARHQAFYAAQQLRPGSKGCPTDVCVPLSQLAECIEATLEDVAKQGVVAPLFGHLGDGNFHLILLGSEESDPDSHFETLFEINDRLIDRALRMGGTCTGEHGIGYGKMKWLEQEHGPGAVQVMRSIKSALDPENRLNPGKVV